MSFDCWKFIGLKFVGVKFKGLDFARWGWGVFKKHLFKTPRKNVFKTQSKKTLLVSLFFLEKINPFFVI